LDRDSGIEYDIVVFETMTKQQAEKKLAEMQPAAKEKVAPAPKKPVTKKKAAKLKIPYKVELELLTKAELEKEMRKHGLELDRRETKDALIKQSVAFLKGK